MRTLHLALAGLLLLSLVACGAEPESTSPTSASPLADGQAPTVPTDTQANPTQRRGLSPGWWTLPEVQTALMLSPEQIDSFTKHLRNDELSYQLAQTALRQSRRRQTTLLEASVIDAEQIRAIHREQLLPQSERIVQINFEARLWVRQQLTPEQVQAALRYSPRFFRARWFRSARGAVREVRLEKP